MKNPHQVGFNGRVSMLPEKQFLISLESPARLAVGLLTTAPTGLTALSACSKSKERDTTIQDHIDLAWFRRELIQNNLAHWLSAAPTENGFFRADLDRQWRPAAKQEATLVSQGRLLYVMATGYSLTGEAAYLQSLRAGADFLLDKYHDDEHGGFFWSVGPDGKPLDTKKTAYGHAFVIFGLSHACRVTGERRYGVAAEACWDTLKARLGDSFGGLRPQAQHDWSNLGGVNSQNPLMHLFESLLTLHDATGSERAFEAAAALAHFIYTRLYDQKAGCLPEMYGLNWTPLPEAEGGYVDIGHQFEWAYLLSRAVEKGFHPRYMATGARMLDWGLVNGYDRPAGGIWSNAGYDGRPRAGEKGWWQQCELLRALARYAARHQREDLWPSFDQSLAFIRRNFLDEAYGGWYESYAPDKGRNDARSRKGSVWKVGYHDTGMYEECLKLVGRAGRE